MRKIIFVNRFFYPDHSATSQLLTDLAFDLADRGWSVMVITSRQLYENSLAGLPVIENVSGVMVRRVISSSNGREKLLGRAFDYLSFYFGAIKEMAKLVKKGDIIVVKTDPPLMSVFGALVAKWRHAILVNWIQDIFPEIASALGVKGFSRGVNGLLKKVRNKAWIMSSENVVLSNKMKAILVKEGVSENNIAVIHNWADGQEILPIAPELNWLRNEWGLENKFVVGYSGNMGRAHDFTTIMSIAYALKDNPNVVFLFIGGGAQKEYIQAEALDKGIINIIFKEYQDRKKLSYSLSVPDLHMISLKPELEGLIVPSKFYGIAAAGRPVLYVGEVDGEIPRVLNEERCGKAIGVGDVDEGVRFIRRMMDERSSRIEMGVNIRRVFERRFEKENALGAWRSLLESLDV